MTEDPNFQRRCSDFVSQHVICCVSSLVSDLAAAYDSVSAKSDIFEEAWELGTSKIDYEEAASQAGWVQTPEGRWWREPHDGEDIPVERLETFLGSGPYLWADNVEDACEFDNLEPYEWEIFEHWAIDDFLANRLQAKGEIVGPLSNLTVWARTTTGQAISMDNVIQEIVREWDQEKANLLKDS